MKRSILTLIEISTLMALKLTAQTAGDVDSLFGTGGKVILGVAARAEGMEILSEHRLNDGRIVSLVETFYNNGGSAYTFEWSLMKINANGTADNSFGQSGYVNINFS